MVDDLVTLKTAADLHCKNVHVGSKNDENEDEQNAIETLLRAMLTLTIKEQNQDRKIAAVHTRTVTATRSPRRRLQASCAVSAFTREPCDAIHHRTPAAVTTRTLSSTRSCDHQVT